MTTEIEHPKDIATATDTWCVTNIDINSSTSFLWTLRNFSRYPKDEVLTSSSFPRSDNKNLKWVLRLHPNGFSTDNQGYVSLFLKLVKSLESNVKIEFTFSVVDSHGNKMETTAGGNTFRLNQMSGFPEFLKRDELFEQSNGLLVDDTLIIYCEIIQHLISNSSGDTKSELEDSSVVTLLGNFGDLFEDSLFSDVILNVSGERINAHKAILSARSPVFAAMFKHEMKESSQKEVNITDISYETMINVLRFIYTGKAPNLETMAENLLSAADKYDLEQLKLMCANVLNSHLSVENSCNTLLLADMHNEFLP